MTGRRCDEETHGEVRGVTVRELLNQCRTALTEIVAIERQIDLLMSTGAPSDGGGGGIRREKIKGADEYTVVSGTNNPEAAREQAVDGYMELLEKKKQHLETLLFEMENVLGSLNDGRARAVLRLYYGVGWSDERIAEEMDTARQVVQKWRNVAVDYLEAQQKVAESCTDTVV